jgi:tetratricopeptide (TPR) repeat protein
VSSAYPKATVLLKAQDKILLNETVAINPAKPYLKNVSISAGLDEHDLRASISVEGKELIAYSPIRLKSEPLPEPVTAPEEPNQIKTNEELYLTGLRIEQFHNPSLDPDPYWEEALRRDPNDVRVNTALGINYLKRGRLEDAEKLLHRAIARLTANYTTPKDAEALYYLGVTLKAQSKFDEAFSTFYKATWNMAWRAASYYSLAEIATMRGDFDEALNFLNRSLEANALNIRALNLKAAVLRHTGHPKQALQLLASSSHKADPLDVRSMAEYWLASKNANAAKTIVSTMLEHPATAQETAAEYFNAGLWQDGMEVLLQMIKAAPDKSRIRKSTLLTGVSPMIYYYLAYFSAKLGQQDKTSEYCRLAEKMPPDYVFPFQNEAIDVLEHAMTVNPVDARAPYYLGNLLFDWQPEKAVTLWEKSVSLDPTFPIAHRNLAIAYSHQKTGNDLDKAIASLEKAVSLPNKYPIHFFELDELYEAAGSPVQKRLALLEQNSEIVTRRDDAQSRAIALKVVMGKYDEAIELLTGRQFEVWEGSSLNVADFWTIAHILRGHKHFEAKQYKEALTDYRQADEIPDNLPSERIGGSGRRAEIAYWIGTAYEALGDQEKAKHFWNESSSAARPFSPRPGGTRPRPGFRGSFGGSAQQYYQSLSLRKLGGDEQAKAIFQQLIKAGTERLQEQTSIDFFASFGQQQLQRSRLADAHYIIGLGYLGLDEKEKAKKAFTETLEVNPAHLGATTELARL